MLITLTPDLEARLRAQAEREGMDLNDLANAVLSAALQPENGGADSRPQASDRQERPFRRDPRLMGIQFQESSVTPITQDDWPEAFK